MKLSMNILPPEMLVKILKLLKYKDLCQAQLICRRWNEIIGKIKTKVAGKILRLRPCHMFCLSLYECNYFIAYLLSFTEKISCIIVAGGRRMKFFQWSSVLEVEVLMGELGTKKLPKLPMQINSSSMVLHNRNILLCGGSDSHCLEL